MCADSQNNQNNQNHSMSKEKRKCGFIVYDFKYIRKQQELKLHGTDLETSSKG